MKPLVPFITIYAGINKSMLVYPIFTKYADIVGIYIFYTDGTHSYCTKDIRVEI